MILTRSLVAFGLAALCLFGSGAPVASAQTSDCLSGQAAGLWNLPSRVERGFVRGLLVQDPRTGRRFALAARLQPEALRQGGKIEGVLSVVTPGAALRPFAEVRGIYVLDSDGRGSFEASILQASAKLVPVEIGKLGGVFADRPTAVVANPSSPGRFLARWALCR